MEHWNTLLILYFSDLILRGRREETVVAYRNHLSRFVHELNEIHPKQCTAIDMRHAYSKVLAMHSQSYRGHGSVRLFSSSVRAFLRWCMHNGYVPPTSLPQQLFSGGRHRGKHTIPIRREEITVLLQTICSAASPNRERDKALFAISAFTGVRGSEPLAMRFFDYDSLAKEIHIRNKGGGVSENRLFQSLISSYVYIRRVVYGSHRRVHALIPICFQAGINAGIFRPVRSTIYSDLLTSRD